MIDTTLIFNDNKYKEYCRYVSNNSSQWEDLYQMFAEELLTRKHIVKTSIENYCKGIIYKLWRSYNGSETSQKKRGEHMMLANYADMGYEVSEWIMQSSPVPVNTRPIEELENLLLSENKSTRHKAQITMDFINGNNRLQISRDRGVNYKTIYFNVDETLEKIKTNMTKNDIQIKLLSEGISASYSGKSKTFYTNKPVSKDLEITIIKAGFKQCKK